MLLKNTVVLAVFALSLLIGGCFDHQHVKGYQGPDLLLSELATIEINANCYLEIDSVPIELPKLGLNDVHVKIKPGIRDIGWSIKPMFCDFYFEKGGTFKVLAGKAYKVHLRWLEKSFGVAQDSATWLEDMETKEVMIGLKPDWFDSNKIKDISF